MFTRSPDDPTPEPYPRNDVVQVVGKWSRTVLQPVFPIWMIGQRLWQAGKRRLGNDVNAVGNSPDRQRCAVADIQPSALSSPLNTCAATTDARAIAPEPK